MILIKSLEETGLVRVPYPTALRRTVERAAGSWERFCALPGSAKTQFAYPDVGNLNEVGYEVKDRPGPTLDRKEMFHVTLRTVAELERTAGESDAGCSRRFLDDAACIIEELSGPVTKLAGAVEAAFGVTGLADEALAGKDQWFVRYLHYFGGHDPGAESAKPHVDKAGLTFHLHETDEGLQRLAFDGTGWHDMPVGSDETVAILGMQGQYRSGGQLRALCHRVVANERTAAIGRWSMVCFVPLVRTPVFNKMGRGRLQEFPSGFNYTMPNEDFRALFA